MKSKAGKMATPKATTKVMATPLIVRLPPPPVVKIPTIWITPKQIPKQQPERQIKRHRKKITKAKGG